MRKLAIVRYLNQELWGINCIHYTSDVSSQIIKNKMLLFQESEKIVLCNSSMTNLQHYYYYYYYYHYILRGYPHHRSVFQWGPPIINFTKIYTIQYDTIQNDTVRYNYSMIYMRLYDIINIIIYINILMV